VGLTEAEIATATGLPKSTVGNELRFVRAWLTARLAGEA
jgi:DNA-directed RNA polymerase specialized sigma24 family protein